ncbi:MAG: hypothetical protein C4575_04600 [Desulforudis sp.]|jgi:type I restriction enzyme S subunit|nr:MAG: hypothetical protein C4575_04600 [Desulforudis sp.]
MKVSEKPASYINTLDTGRNMGCERLPHETDKKLIKFLPLENVVEIVSGFGFPKALQGKTDGELPFFKVGDISLAWNNGQRGLTKAQHYLDQEEALSIKARPYPKGTVVFAKIGEAIKLNRRAILGQPAIVDNNVMGLIPKEDMANADYLFYWTLTLRLGDISQATTVPSVRKSDVKQLPFPWVPLEQQKRIVAEIEKQFSRLDEAVANLKRVKANLKRYKAAVLKAAVEGKLTEEWRKQHPDVESASKLLKRILVERRQKWEEAELAKMKAKGKLPKDDKWKKKYKEPPKVDASNLPDLPTGWVWTNFEQLAEDIPNALKAGPFGSALKKSFYVPKGYKIYGQEQVIRDDPSYGDYYINEARYKQLESCAVKSGDMLVSLVGTIGRILVLPEDIEPGIINPRLVKMSLDFRIVDPIFIRAYIQSPYVKYLFAIASHGGTMDILNMTILKGIPIPLPPSEEQKMILDEFDRVATIEAELEKASSTNLLRAERLRQSILSKAFSGELTVEDEKGMENKCQTRQ